MTLTTKQSAHLRSLGHHLDAIVMVGKDGVTEGVIGALDQALVDHELVKVRVGKNVVAGKRSVADELAERTKSHCAQVLGNTVLLYRAHPDKPEIKLPR